MPRDFNVKDLGATGSGSTDDSIAIRNAIAAAVAAGGGVVYFPNGTYIISADGSNPWCLLLSNNITLRGETRESAILKMAAMQTGDRRLLSMTGVHDVNICNLSIDGNKLSNPGLSEQAHGIFASATVRLTVSGVTCYDNKGDGVYVHGNSSDALIENCYIHDNARNGVSIAGGGQERIIVRSCQIRNNIAQQIDTEMNVGAFVKDITVEDCHLVSLTDFALTLSG
jgi:polygalacturonase